jgi:hypothetical protein
MAGYGWNILWEGKETILSCIVDENILSEINTRVEAGSNTSTVTLRVVGGDEKGSLKSETVIGTRTRERLRWRGLAAYTKDRAVLSSERAPHKIKTVTVKELQNIWSWAPDGAQHQDLLTVWPSVATWLWLCKFSVVVQLSVGSQSVKIRLYVCCSWTELRGFSQWDYYKYVSRIRLVKTEKT